MNTINESKVRTFPYYKDENYTVYEDGRMYSHYKNKFLKPTITYKKQALYGKHGSVARVVWQSVHGELDKKWEDYLDSEKGSVDEDREWDKAMDDLGATMAKVFPYFKNNNLRG